MGGAYVTYVAHVDNIVICSSTSKAPSTSTVTQTANMNFISLVRTLSPLIGMQAGIGGCHLPWRHLDTRILLLMWNPGSQKKWMVLFWGKPRHGDGSQRKPPCSGTRGWVQLLSRPVKTQNHSVERIFNSSHSFVLFVHWNPRHFGASLKRLHLSVQAVAAWAHMSFLSISVLISEKHPQPFSFTRWAAMPVQSTLLPTSSTSSPSTISASVSRSLVFTASASSFTQTLTHEE